MRDEIRDLKKDLEFISDKFKDDEGGKKKSYRLPGKAKRLGKVAKKKGGFLGIILKANKNIEFRLVELKHGLLKFGEYEFNAFENDAVYHYKNMPVVVVLEWRLLPVGGRIESYKNDDSFKYSEVGGKADEVIANKYNLTGYAAQTIIRAIAAAKVDKEEGAKKKLSMVWILIIGGIALYLVLKALGMA